MPTKTNEKISKLKNVSLSSTKKDPKGVVTQLISDHKKMKLLMKKIKSSRSTDQLREKAFKVLVMMVKAHVKSEEKSLLNFIKEHPRLKDMAAEGIEEHRLHDTVIAQVQKTKDLAKKSIRIKIFCEMLEHHLEEEENDLFPAFKKYTATSTRKKMGSMFRSERNKLKKTNEEKMYRETLENNASL